MNWRKISTCLMAAAFVLALSVAAAMAAGGGNGGSSGGSGGGGAGGGSGGSGGGSAGGGSSGGSGGGSSGGSGGASAGGGSSGGAGGGSSGGSGGASAGGGSGGGSAGGGSSGGGAGGGGNRLTIANDSGANAYYQQAQTALAGADYWTAADLLQKVLSRQPDNPDVLNLMGFSERKLGYGSTALYYYKKALNLQPNHIGANEYLGELYLELKQPNLAEQRLVVLQQTCGNCEEYTELKEKIEKFKANPS